MITGGIVRFVKRPGGLPCDSSLSQKRGELRTNDGVLKGMPTPHEWLKTEFLSVYNVPTKPEGDDIVDFYDTSKEVDGFM